MNVFEEEDKPKKKKQMVERSQKSRVKVKVKTLSSASSSKCHVRSAVFRHSIVRMLSRAKRQSCGDFLLATFIESFSRNDKIQFKRFKMAPMPDEETRPKAILMNKDEEMCAVCIRSGRKKLIEDIVKMI